MDCIASLPSPQTAPQPGTAAPAGSPQGAFAALLARFETPAGEPPQGQPAPADASPADAPPPEPAAAGIDPAALAAAIVQPAPCLPETVPTGLAEATTPPPDNAQAQPSPIAGPDLPVAEGPGTAPAVAGPQPTMPAVPPAPGAAEAAAAPLGHTAPRRAPMPAAPGARADAPRTAAPATAGRNGALAHFQTPTTDDAPIPPPPPGTPAPAAAMVATPVAEAAARGDTAPRPATEAPTPLGEAASAGIVTAPPPREARAPEAAPPPAPPAPATPARQIAPVVVAVAIAGGTARLSVTLEPAELGRVEISVEHQGAVADVRVVAERPETLALLQRDQRELDRALAQAGIGTDGRSLSFQLSDGGAGAFASGRDAEGRGRMARGMPDASGSAAEAPAAAPPRRLLSLIDLAV